MPSPFYGVLIQIPTHSHTHRHTHKHSFSMPVWYSHPYTPTVCQNTLCNLLLYTDSLHGNSLPLTPWHLGTLLSAASSALPLLFPQQQGWHTTRTTVIVAIPTGTGGACHAALRYYQNTARRGGAPSQLPRKQLRGKTSAVVEF